MTPRPVLCRWADDLFLHGNRLAGWITDYVDLEESLAVGSMAQEDLAHAAVLLRLAGVTAEERHERIFERPVGEWYASALVTRPVDDWPGTVARGFLLAEGMLTLCGWLRDGGDEPLARGAGAILPEQQLHARHWHRWVNLLGRDPAARAGFVAALGELAVAACDLFGTPGGAADAGGGATCGDLHGRWRAGVQARALELCGQQLAVPEGPAPRLAGVAGGDLDRTLRQVRSVRAANPARRYEIYD